MMTKKKQRTNGKRVIAALAAILMFLMMAAMMTGCEEDKNDADPTATPSATPPANSTPDEYPFVGTWEWDNEGAVYTITFRRDGTGHYTGAHEGEVWVEFNFEWEIDEDGDISYVDEDGDGDYFIWEMDGDRRLVLDGDIYNRV